MVLFQEMMMLIRQQDHLIWQRWIIYFGVMWKLRSIQIFTELKDKIIHLIDEIEPQYNKILLTILTKDGTDTFLKIC